MAAETTFDATQDTLEGLLKEIGSGKLQLPDFQRGWVWDDRHIKSLITSVSRAFPVGAVMLLQTGGDVRFQPRLVEGVDGAAVGALPDRLILDGQQRLTSLYQALTLTRPIKTRDDKGKVVERWYYVDMRKALGSLTEREEAVFSIRPDKKITRDFDRNVILDISSPEREYENYMFPINKLFDTDAWSDGWMEYSNYDAEKIKFFNRFRNEYIQAFKTYQIPIIQLRKSASKEAVCLVFEKVNTGGVALTAFELLTATYAADGYNLRQDWLGGGQNGAGRAASMGRKRPVLKAVENTDFLQCVSLLHTHALRESERERGRAEMELPAVSCTRATILGGLPLPAYQAQADEAQIGFERAAQFLWRERIFTGRDLPYRTQLVPLAAILASLGSRWQEDGVRSRVRQWFWCGVFGELYGSAIESRFAKDLQEVLPWALGGGETPTTVIECNFVTDRLLTMRSRLSAAYKGLHALVMQEGAAKDWRTGAAMEEQTYFDENVDIHHIFPRAWCEKQGIRAGIYDSIVNKTALSSTTNRIVGGDRPSAYLRRLESNDMPPSRLDALIATHFIEAPLLRADNFFGMIEARAGALAREIEAATGRPVGGRTPKDVFSSPALEDVEPDPVEELAAA